MNLLHTRAHTHGNTLSFLDSNARTSFETSRRPPAPCDFPASLGGFPPLFTALSWLPCPAVRLFDFAPDSKLSKVLFGSSPSSRSPQSLESSRPSATDSVSETRSERGRSGPHRGLGPALWTSGPASSSSHAAPGAEEAESDEAPGSSPAPRKPGHLWEPHCHRPPFLRDRTPACRSTPETPLLWTTATTSETSESFEADGPLLHLNPLFTRQLDLAAWTLSCVCSNRSHFCSSFPLRADDPGVTLHTCPLAAGQAQPLPSLELLLEHRLQAQGSHLSLCPICPGIESHVNEDSPAEGF